jgi:hypothetical protein
MAQLASVATELWASSGPLTLLADDPERSSWQAAIRYDIKMEPGHGHGSNNRLVGAATADASSICHVADRVDDR